MDWIHQILDKNWQVSGKHNQGKTAGTTHGTIYNSTL